MQKPGVVGGEACQPRGLVEQEGVERDDAFHAQGFGVFHEVVRDVEAQEPRAARDDDGLITESGGFRAEAGVDMSEVTGDNTIRDQCDGTLCSLNLPGLESACF
jgi:hypothetical protein